jgi:RimJ/RimL family protein N-acetyltransferase
MNNTLEERGFKELPVGEAVKNTTVAQIPASKLYPGEFVSLQPVDPEKDVVELYKNSHGSAANARIWTYMPYGPFDAEADMRDWMKGCQSSSDPLFFSVFSKELNQRVGMVSFLNIAASMRTLELGNIWYSPLVHNTRVNTEAIYLMLSEAFDNLCYRRVEWKCDSLNARSRAAAVRLGFSFEGIFKQHFIIKGRNRDTSWYAMLDCNWPAIKINIQKWLQADKSCLSLAKLNEPLLRATDKRDAKFLNTAGGYKEVSIEKRSLK